MKNSWKIITILLLTGVLSGCGPKRSGVEILSEPTAKVYIDGKLMGTTPYNNKNLDPGVIKVKIEPEEKTLDPWEGEAVLQNFADTVIQLRFSKKGVGGYILGLEPNAGSKNAGLLLSSSPSEAAIKIEDALVGFSPLNILRIEPGDRHINVAFPGYKAEDIYAKGVEGYQLTLSVFLDRESASLPTTNVEKIDTVSSTKEQVKIKTTETGWLRVRSGPSATATELAKVKPGEIYDLLQTQVEWIEIRVKENLTGWILARYAEKVATGSPERLN